MDVIIHTTNSMIKWQELVGKEHTDLGYKVIINSYSSETKKLSISEFHNDYPYTSEIVTIDNNRCANILSNYGFNIDLIEEFTYSNSTIYRMKGLQQAGFTYITYNNETQKFMIDDTCELTFLTIDEQEHLLISKLSIENERLIENKILIDDIINNRI